MRNLKLNIFPCLLFILISCKNDKNKDDRYHIQKIEFSSFNIRGKTEIIITKDLNFSFKHEHSYYDTVITNNAKFELPKKIYVELDSMLNRMDFPNLKDSLRSGGTCQPICELKITYDHGKVKKIFDEGLDENKDLHKLYDKIEKLRPNNTTTR